MRTIQSVKEIMLLLQAQMVIRINFMLMDAAHRPSQIAIPPLDYGDVVTLRALDNGSGCDTFNTGITMSVLNLRIDIQPVVNQTVSAGVNAIFSTSTAHADTFQWQVSTNRGVGFNAINDGTLYSGTTSASLTIISSDINMNIVKLYPIP